LCNAQVKAVFNKPLNQRSCIFGTDKIWFVRPIIPVMRFLGNAPYASFLSAKNVYRDLEFAGFKKIKYCPEGV